MYIGDEIIIKHRYYGSYYDQTITYNTDLEGCKLRKFYLFKLMLYDYEK